MKFLSTIVAFLLATTAVHAQDYLLNDDDTYMFNHMSLGLSGGTNGVGLDFALPLGKYVQVRAGVSYMPAVSMTSALECVTTESAYTLSEDGRSIEYKYDNNGNKIREQKFVTNEFDGGMPREVDIKATPKFLNGKLLFDFYASPSFPLHLTLGAYFGAEKIITLESVDNEMTLQEMFSHTSSNYSTYGYENCRGVKMGNYTLIPDKDGKINSWIQTSAIRPYAGLGYGKAYSEKGIDWMVEAGVIFWNKPKVYSSTTPLDSDVEGERIDVELKEEDLCGTKAPLLKFMSKTSIYPVISFRLGFNMF
ncbi:MAG: hypothetical protein J5663_09075 [Bacteroidaceae bacterium]|nr:hypothetical protein [Bacteroidaceae bacterium]